MNMIEILQAKVVELKAGHGNDFYAMFVKDFERAVSFYENAKTGNKTISGELERRADKYAGMLIRHYLHAEDCFASNKTGMQKLAVISQIKNFVKAA